MPRGRAKKKTQYDALMEMPAFSSFVVHTAKERDRCVNLANKYMIPLASLKLNGQGWQIIKLKLRPIYHCPNCGWKGRKT